VKVVDGHCGLFQNNCPIRQFTADNVSVGRCWHWLGDNRTCPIHGDVSLEVERYIRDGSLTDESTRPTMAAQEPRR
jgi:hypothetical protein